MSKLGGLSGVNKVKIFFQLNHFLQYRQVTNQLSLCNSEVKINNLNRSLGLTQTKEITKMNILKICNSKFILWTSNLRF